MESFAAIVPVGLSSIRDIGMLKHVDDLLTTGKPAGCWFHQRKGDSTGTIMVGLSIAVGDFTF